MLKLIIKETGHIFFAPGIPEVRTPVEIIITKLNRASLIINLRSQGISNYKIVEIPKINVEKKKPEEKNKQKLEIVKKDDEVLKILQHLVDKLVHNKHDSTKNVYNRLDNIESMMKDLVSRPIGKFMGKEEIVKDGLFDKKKQKFEEDEDLFVPSIHTSGMKIQETKSTFRKERVDSNVEESSELLSKIKRKKPNKIN